MADSPPRDDLYRALMPGAELRTSEDGTATMFGHFSKFDEWAEIRSAREGRFLERVARGAFAKTMRENAKNMRVLFHHGLDAIGVQVLGEILELREDAEGAYYEVALFEGLPQLLLDGIRAGVYGSSYRFEVMREEFDTRTRRTSAHNPEGLPERTILEARVREFGPTPFPAFAGATSGIRSITDDVLVQRIAADPERLAELVTRSNSVSLYVPTSATATAWGSSVRVVNPLDEARAQERRYDKVIADIATAKWLMHESKLNTILEIVAERASGYRPTREEIEERIGTPPDPDGDAVVDAGSSIAVIPIRGAIIPRANLMTEMSGGATVDQLEKQFAAAVNDPTVEAIVLDVDSPGGNAKGIPEFAQAIRDARGSKPIVASVNATAASAAYWLATQADEVHVTPSGEVGSIGVWTAHNDISSMQEKAGVKTTIVSAGKYKVEANPFEPLSDEARAQLQSEVDEIHASFVDAVAAGRGVTADTVSSDFGQGRMLSAKRAVSAGMADRVSTFAQTLDDLKQRLASDATPAAAASEAAAAPHENETSAGTAATAAAHPHSGRRGQIGTTTDRRPKWHL